MGTIIEKGLHAEDQTSGSSGMAFTFAAFAYLIALTAVAFCIFFAIYTVVCIDELKTG
ncbi:hypothetical protein COOONC_23627 [Cooperia oncophora]